MGKRPTAFILRKNADGKWSEYDYLLAEALELLENEYCPRCGQPKYLCRNESDEIQFKVRDEHCYAAEAVEREQKRNAEKKNYDDAGVTLIAVPFSTQGRPLSEYRDRYYSDLIKKRETIAKLEGS